ncbi:MAG TPA: nuclear transport factor 2 family protein [Solirubrobacterales bacterium]|jgi:ketosteroid isomerase-like protein|nr:nuclear transport factor 2 family protein [Solirubrobacterales bacterium]
MRRGFEAFSRGDLDAGLAEIHPEIEWHLAFRLPDLPPEKTVFLGHDEVRDLWAAFRGVWDELTLEGEELLYDSDDVVIERVRFRGRGGASGIEVDRVIHYVQEMRDGKLVRIRPFDSAEEAFAAAGVERE